VGPPGTGKTLLARADDGTTVRCRDWLRITLDELEVGGHLVGNTSYVPDLRRLADGAPTSAVRQLKVFERTRNLDSVTLALAEEFEADVLGGATLTESEAGLGDC
jgi:MoxR-like ATPase